MARIRKKKISRKDAKAQRKRRGINSSIKEHYRTRKEKEDCEPRKIKAGLGDAFDLDLIKKQGDISRTRQSAEPGGNGAV